MKRERRHRLAGEHVPVPVAPATAAHPEETDLLLSWLDSPGVRLVTLTTPLTCPVAGAQRYAGADRTVREVATAAGHGGDDAGEIVPGDAEAEGAA